MTIPAGTRLGVYEVAAQIGAGGMGEVYRAHDTRLNRDVALKVLPGSICPRYGAHGALRARSESSGLAQSSEYRSDLWPGRIGPIRALVMELVRRADAGRAHRGRAGAC